MRITTKIEIKDESVVIPKNTIGSVVCVEWGDKNGFIVDFPQHSRVFVKREDVIILIKEEKNESQKNEKEIKSNKQTWKKEM